MLSLQRWNGVRFRIKEKARWVQDQELATLNAQIDAQSQELAQGGSAVLGLRGRAARQALISHLEANVRSVESEMLEQEALYASQVSAATSLQAFAVGTGGGSRGQLSQMYVFRPSSPLSPA